tara:strand:+ start:1937 stop:2521 length:585 start_codon:yes stop_codon:yes gene_type:complete
MDNSDFIIRYTGAFSKEDCGEIIKYIEHFEGNNLLTYDDTRLDIEDHRVISINNDFNVDLPASSIISRLILPRFKPCVDDYVKRYSLLSKNKFLIYDIKLKKIPSGAGFHAWHYENGSPISATRTFVIQLYLNDEFEGGETEFLYQNRREQSVTGDVIIFPAGYTHVHRGNPPIGGTKYIANTWAIVQDNGGEE